MNTAANASKRSVTAANGFLAWLGHGLNAGAVRYNERGAFAYFGKEGLYLLSPIAFQEFVFLTNARYTWESVQRGMQRKRISMRNPFQRGTFLHRIFLDGFTHHCFVISNPQEKLGLAFTPELREVQIIMDGIKPKGKKVRNQPAVTPAATPAQVQAADRIAELAQDGDSFDPHAFLADPAKRAMVLKALREGRRNEATLFDDLGLDSRVSAERYGEERDKADRRWDVLSIIVHVELEALHRRHDLPPLEQINAAAIPPHTWHHISKYRELFQFWYPEYEIPDYASIVAFAQAIADEIMRRYPGVGPFDALQRNEAFKLIRSFLGNQLDGNGCAD